MSPSGKVTGADAEAIPRPVGSDGRPGNTAAAEVTPETGIGLNAGAGSEGRLARALSTFGAAWPARQQVSWSGVLVHAVGSIPADRGRTGRRSPGYRRRQG